jgi:hypothetical protein
LKSEETSFKTYNGDHPAAYPQKYGGSFCKAKTNFEWVRKFRLSYFDEVDPSDGSMRRKICRPPEEVRQYVVVDIDRQLCSLNIVGFAIPRISRESTWRLGPQSYGSARSSAP